MQRDTVNCYATLHVGKGRAFYSRLCHLDGIKAKDGQRNYSSGSAYQQLRALIVGQGRRQTRNRVLRARKVAIVLDAGARRGAKSEPLAVFVRTPEEEIFVNLADVVRPQGREGGGGSETADDDPDAANAQLYDDIVRKVFDQLGIEWKVIEERIIAVVSDGADTMGAYVGLLNNIREKGGKELIGWVKDAAHCLMRGISTAKRKVKLWTMHWMIRCPSLPASTGPAPSACGGCGKREGSFVFPAALVCVGWKRCSTSWTLCWRTCLLLWSNRPSTLVMRLTQGGGRRPRACSMHFRTPSSS